MKRILFIVAVLLTSIFGQANEACDMFDAELSIVQDQMKSIVEDVESCKKLAETAGDEKNQSTDEKMIRLIKSAHKQSDLMSHSITQISLRKECACEGFDFELVNQKIIEIKYWIKRAESVDLGKQKSDQYESLSSNVTKLSEILAAFAAYIYDPCKSEKPPVPEATEEKEAPKDTVIAEVAPIIPPVVEDTTPTVEPVPEPVPVAKVDTVVTPVLADKDTVPVEEVIPEVELEVIVAVVPKDTIVEDTVLVKDTVLTEDTVMIRDSILVQDTVMAVDTIIAETPLPLTPVLETIVKVDTTLAEEIVPVIDSIQKVEEVVVEEEIAEEPEEINSPEVEVTPTPEIVIPTPEIAPVVAPKPNPVSKKEEVVGFYYAVQVAAGSDRTTPSSVSAINEDVYIHEEGGMNKFRVGHFATLSEAANSKNAIFKKGITDAFIVAYADGKKIGIGEAKKIEAGSSPAAGSTTSDNTPIKKKDAPKPISSKIKNKAEVFLAVQIGASITAADPIYELAKYEHQLQMRIKVIQGAPVRYYTGETKNKNEAEQTLSLVKSKGVEGAFLIGISNGERVDYKAALGHLDQ